jgi:hypothetical protein
MGRPDQTHVVLVRLPDYTQSYLRIFRNFFRSLFRASADFFFFLTLGLSYARLLLTSPRIPDRCNCFLNRLIAFSNGSSSLTTTPGMVSCSFPGRIRPGDRYQAWTIHEDSFVRRTLATWREVNWWKLFDRRQQFLTMRKCPLLSRQVSLQRLHAAKMGLSAISSTFPFNG